MIVNPLRDQFLEQVRLQSGQSGTAGKVLISKGESPDLLTIRNARNEVIGFGSPERVSREEISHLVNLDNLNACFDTMFYGPDSIIESSSSSPRNMN